MESAEKYDMEKEKKVLRVEKDKWKSWKRDGEVMEEECGGKWKRNVEAGGRGMWRQVEEECGGRWKRNVEASGRGMWRQVKQRSFEFEIFGSNKLSAFNDARYKK